MVSSQTMSDFEDLEEDMIVLSLHLNDFRTLYAEDRANVELLNTIDPGTFWVFQNALRDSIILRVTRLTDDVGRIGRENLTLKALIKEVEKDGDANLAQQLNNKHKDVDAQTEPVRTLRNKVTAHTDRSIRRGAIPVPNVRIEELYQAVKSIWEFLNVFDQAVNDNKTIYPLSIMDGEGGILLSRLREAVAYQQFPLLTS